MAYFKNEESEQTISQILFSEIYTWLTGILWFFNHLEQRTQQNYNSIQSNKKQQNDLVLRGCNPHAAVLWQFFFFCWFLSATGIAAGIQVPWTDCVTGIRRHPWLSLTGRLGTFLGKFKDWTQAPWSAGVISGQRIILATLRHTKPQPLWPWSPWLQ